MCVSVRVTILGEEHLIKGDASPEYIKKLAHYVDAHLRKIHNQNPTLPRHKAAILAALNIADELERLRRSMMSFAAPGGVTALARSLLRQMDRHIVMIVVTWPCSVKRG